jgi:hypothetical protein
MNNLRSPSCNNYNSRRSIIYEININQSKVDRCAQGECLFSLQHFSAILGWNLVGRLKKKVRCFSVCQGEERKVFVAGLIT